MLNIVILQEMRGVWGAFASMLYSKEAHAPGITAKSLHKGITSTIHSNPPPPVLPQYSPLSSPLLPNFPTLPL